MKTNVWYLFMLGLSLGSGPCLSLCAPVLVSYSAALRHSFKKSLLAYCVFSLARLISYVILGLAAVLGIKFLHSPLISPYLRLIHYSLGIFIVAIGAGTIFYQEKKPSRLCRGINTANMRNVAILGLLIGLSPCLPLLGSVLPYLVIVSNSLLEGFVYALSFGLGTALSPLLLLMMFSAKAAQLIGKNAVIAMWLRIACGLIIATLGIIIILQTLTP